MSQVLNTLGLEEATQVPLTAVKQHGVIYKALVFGSSLSTKHRCTLYLSMLLVSLTLVWGPVLLVLILTSDQFTSQWTLIMPGAGNGHAVNLDSIGQATANIASPFTNSSIDPLVNYREIATSTPVLAKAASYLGIPAYQFGKPRIKLINQTSLMSFQVKGETAEQARDKSLAIYQALQEQLEILRNDEVSRITHSSLTTIEDFSSKLHQTQHDKLNYQNSNSIVSLGQFEQLVTRMETDLSNQEQLTARLQFLKGQTQQLLISVGLKSKEVSYALSLRNDTLFQSQLRHHADIQVQIDITSATWGGSHPKLNQLLATLRAIRQALTNRGRQIISNFKLDSMKLIDLGSSEIETGLLQKLAQHMAEEAGLRHELQQIKANISQLRQRIENSAADAIKLEELSRKQQVATAVFSTALAKQDIGKVDRFASYPLLQILAEPTLPESPDKLHIKLALGGGAAATLFILIGLLTLWIRKRLLQKILQSGSSGTH